MLFELFGLIVSTLVGAFLISLKITGDIYPAALKKWINFLYIKNYLKSKDKFKLNNYASGNKPKTTDEIGLLASEEERSLEEPKIYLAPNESDEISFYGIDDNENYLFVKIKKQYENFTSAHLSLLVNQNLYSDFFEGVVESSNSSEFRIGNLKIEIVEPMRCARIWYNGMLKNEKSSTKKHVTLHCLWKPLCSLIQHPAHLNPYLLSHYLTNSSSQSIFDLNKILPEGYSHQGTLHGEIGVDEGKKFEFYFYGKKIRNFETRERVDSYVEFFGVSAHKGNSFSLTGNIYGWYGGEINVASGEEQQIKKADIDPSNFFKNSSLQMTRTFNIKTSEKCFIVEIWPNFKKSTYSNFEILTFSLTINGASGSGLVIIHKDSKINLDQIIKNHSKKLDVIQSESILRANSLGDDSSDFFITFDSLKGKNVQEVGGKGASLSYLHQLQKSSPNNDFKTANGFIVSTSAFLHFLPISKIENILSDSTPEACLEVMELIKSSSAASLLQPLITQTLTSIFPSPSSLKFAVRSSGVLEDGLNLSCAGQNSTFLCIPMPELSTKIVECWASLFTPTSVGYRVQWGGRGMSLMGVVVQEMVGGETGGVIFTNHPTTGNPCRMILTANHGLGESVVSGLSEPDTFELFRDFNNEKRVELQSKTLGSKKQKIIMNEKTGTTETLENPQNSEFCVSDAYAVKLGQIGNWIEEKYGDLRGVDIEWAINRKGEIYILQSRSITSLDSWTDFELIHELDTPYPSTSEVLTHANTGEVMPGALSPLGISIVHRTLNSTIDERIRYRKGQGSKLNPYNYKSLSISRSRVLINLINTLYNSIDNEINTANICADLSVFGHKVINEKYHLMAKDRHGVEPPHKKSMMLFKFIKCIKDSKGELERNRKIYENYKCELPSEKLSAKEIYELITKKLIDNYNISACHCMMSEASSVTQMFAILTLAQGRNADEWNSEIYDDISQVLSVCMDVESAELPSQMESLANNIVRNGGPNIQSLFLDAKPTEAFNWLENNESSSIKGEVKEFLHRHGHRCISELDLISKSWKSDPVPFTSLLQSIVRSKLKFQKEDKVKRESETVVDLVQRLKTPLNKISRGFLKFLIPYCRAAVMNREKSKSMLVRVGNELKLAYNALATQMCKEQLLPNPQLIFFLTHYQISLLLESHSSTPQIINKALRRLKLFPQLNREEFSEITEGIRGGREAENFNSYDSNEVVKGTPVCMGRVEGVVKVCVNLQEAAETIEEGDILITNATDIAWSSFFPLLSGIVTELGGLISHGAVVAREYGLPCIVGAQNATKMLKSGQRVILDASKGTITVLK